MLPKRQRTDTVETPAGGIGSEEGGEEGGEEGREQVERTDVATAGGASSGEEGGEEEGDQGGEEGGEDENREEEGDETGAEPDPKRQRTDVAASGGVSSGEEGGEEDSEEEDISEEGSEEGREQVERTDAAAAEGVSSSEEDGEEDSEEENSEEGSEEGSEGAAGRKQSREQELELQIEKVKEGAKKAIHLYGTRLRRLGGGEEDSQEESSEKDDYDGPKRSREMELESQLNEIKRAARTATKRLRTRIGKLERWDGFTLADYLEFPYENDKKNKMEKEFEGYFQSRSPLPTSWRPAELSEFNQPPIPVAMIPRHPELGLGCVLFYPDPAGNTGDLVFCFPEYNHKKTFKVEDEEQSILIASQLKILNCWLLGESDKNGRPRKDICQRWAGRRKAVAGCLLSKCSVKGPDPIPLEMVANQCFKEGRVYITTEIDIREEIKANLDRITNEQELESSEPETKDQFSFLNIVWACSTMYVLASTKFEKSPEKTMALSYVCDSDTWKSMYYLVQYEDFIAHIADCQGPFYVKLLAQLMGLLLFHDQRRFDKWELDGGFILRHALKLSTMEDPTTQDQAPVLKEKKYLSDLAVRAFGRSVISEMLEENKEMTIEYLIDKEEGTILATTLAMIARGFTDHMVKYPNYLHSDGTLKDVLPKILENTPDSMKSLLTKESIQRGYNDMYYVFENFLENWMRHEVRVSRAGSHEQHTHRSSNRAGAYRRCLYISTSIHLKLNA